MKSRASRAVPFYIFSAPSFLCAKWHKFCFLCASLKFRHREKCFDFGTNRHRESLWANRSDVPPRDPSTRLPRARTFYMVLYILSLYPPHFVSLALLSFSAPSPRRPSFSLRFPRSPSPLSLPSLHPFDSRSKENHSRSKEISERFVRKHPFKTVTCALQIARQSLCNPPQKQKKCRFSQIF